MSHCNTSASIVNVDHHFNTMSIAITSDHLESIDLNEDISDIRIPMLANNTKNVINQIIKDTFENSKNEIEFANNLEAHLNYQLTLSDDFINVGKKKERCSSLFSVLSFENQVKDNCTDSLNHDQYDSNIFGNELEMSLTDFDPNDFNLSFDEVENPFRREVFKSLSWASNDDAEIIVEVNSDNACTDSIHNEQDLVSPLPKLENPFRREIMRSLTCNHKTKVNSQSSSLPALVNSLNKDKPKSLSTFSKTLDLSDKGNVAPREHVNIPSDYYYLCPYKRIDSVCDSGYDLEADDDLRSLSRGSIFTLSDEDDGNTAVIEEELIEVSCIANQNFEEKSVVNCTNYCSDQFSSSKNLTINDITQIVQDGKFLYVHFISNSVKYEI